MRLLVWEWWYVWIPILRFSSYAPHACMGYNYPDEQDFLSPACET